MELKTRAHKAIFQKGLKAASEGKPRIAPYKEDRNVKSRNKNGVTFRKGCNNVWLAGYDSYGT